MTAGPPIGSEFEHFRIDASIGSGLTGSVYKAWDTARRREVALKLIAPRVAQSPGFHERFMRDSKLAEALWHPNLASVYEADELSGVLYVATQLIDGVDLGTELERSRRLDPERAARIVAQIAAALDAAHSRELVHRGIKPSAIIVAREEGVDHPYLTDFGITADSASGETMQTPPPDYAAPEQIEGRSLDGRTDVYALGCLLHQLLTGKPPFARDDTPATLAAHLYDEAPRASSVADGVPAAMDEVLAQAMAKMPDDRFATAGDFGREVLAAAGLTTASESGHLRTDSDKQRVIRAWQRSIEAGGHQWSPSAAHEMVSGRPARSGGGGGGPSKGPAPGPGKPVRREKPMEEPPAPPATGTNGTAPPPAPKDEPAEAAALEPPAEEKPPREEEPKKAAAAAAAPPAAAAGARKPAPGARPAFAQVPPATDNRRRGALIGGGLVALAAVVVAILAIAGVFSSGSSKSSKHAAAPPATASKPSAKAPAPTTTRPHKPAATKPAHKRRAPRAGRVGAWPAGTNGYTAVVFVSSSDRATALAFARRVARLGYPAGVLRSSDYSSLQPGSFVAFAGVYKSPAQADDAVARIRASGIAGAPYARFIGGHR